MDVIIKPSSLEGAVAAIGSKSDIHRLLILSALCDSQTVVEGFSESADTLATVECLKALGAGISISGRSVSVTPIECVSYGARLDCSESGSTLRFLLPVAAAVSEKTGFVGSGRLPERPIGDLMDAMENGGVRFSSPKLPLEISGRIKAGVYTLPGNVSSQYVSGLLMALAVTEGESEIRLSSPLESASYVKMTLSSLSIFGAKAYEIENGYKIVGRKRLVSPKKVVADGDWSNAAFFICSSVINRPLSVSSLRADSVQGDKKVVDMLSAMGAKVEVNNGEVKAVGGVLKGARIDLTDTPDLLPILAVTAAFAEGKTEFYGAKRLRLKESDRLKTVADMINSLGGRAEILPDGLTVYPERLKGGTVDGCNDHRIVMAAAIAAAVCESNTLILGAEAVNKSYPTFFEDFKALGGAVTVI